MGKSKNDELMIAAANLLSAMVKIASESQHSEEESRYKEKWEDLETMLEDVEGDSVDEKVGHLLEELAQRDEAWSRACERADEESKKAKKYKDEADQFHKQLARANGENAELATQVMQLNQRLESVTVPLKSEVEFLRLKGSNKKLSEDNYGLRKAHEKQQDTIIALQKRIENLEGTEKAAY